MRGRLVELDPGLAAAALDAAKAAELTDIEVVVADAGVTDSYLGAAPVDLVIACGVLGNISDHDVETTVRAMPSLCNQGGTVIWTLHRSPPDPTPTIRHWFSEAGFSEQSFTSPGVNSFAVGVHRLDGPTDTLIAGQRLFTFLRDEMAAGPREARRRSGGVHPVSGRSSPEGGAAGAVPS